MKRVLLLLAVVASTTLFQSCEGDTGPQGPAGPDSLVFELQNVDFTLANGEYSIYRTFGDYIGGNLFDSETVLVYRMSGTIDPQTPIWQLIPRTLYLDQGELDYDYDFSVEDFYIYAGGNYDIATTPAYLSNQTFRIVVVPGSFANKSASVVDLNNYNAVIKAYGLENAKIIQL